ncbi:MAG: SpaH/EbpB family LPXTG-anchored major pilin, partial [Clostridioides sp.]|nr:SpaH/EbpB family LPXTG-anchored major pilin [Clostridioides sp.]
KRFTFVNNVSAYLSGGDLTSNESLSISDTGSDDIKFIKDTDASGDTLTWKLTNSGIDKVVLLAKNTSKKMAIQVTFELQVNNNAQGATDGQNTSTNGITTEIDNGASLSIKDADGTDEGIKSVALEDQPILQLSRLEITKWEAKASDGTPLTDKPLPGAKFKIATLKKDAEDGKYIKDKNNQDMEIITGNNPRTKDPETNWAAFVCISLPVNEGEKLYLVETKAPEGYIKRDTIIEVTFTKAEIDAKHKEEQVVNQKNGNPAIPDDNPSFELPKTGGMGTIAFWAVGIALIGTAGFMLIRLQQRKNEEAN